MDQPYKVVMAIKSTGEVVETSGHIPSEDWAQLLRFRDEVDELITYLRRCDNLNVNYSLNWDSEGNLSAEVHDTVDDRDIVVILHRLRPFQLNDEPSCFYRMANVLKRHMGHDVLKPCFQYFRDLFSGKDFQSQMSLTLMSDDQKDLIVNCEKTLMDWINAYEYHRDDEKRRLIEDLDTTLPEEFSRSMFKSMLLDKVKAVIYFRNMISALERRGGSTISIPLS
ncbi:MAG: hypothetical protein OXH81_22775 [Gemmatimonadetes bacterium]|nr:hypothetical protein [Gemmatimonadota bacterium]